jgi:hypothetical protein
VKIGDLVKFEVDKSGPFRVGISSGLIVAEIPADHIVAASVSVLWSSGELVKRVPPRILEVISESR